MSGKCQPWVSAALRIAFSLSLSGLLSNGQAGPASPAQAATAAKMTEEAYKNIQVLKGLPADQLIPGHAVRDLFARCRMQFLPCGGRIREG